MNSKKYPISEALSLLEECVVESFVWVFDDHEEAITHRNSVTSTQCRRKESDLKITTSLVRAIKDNKIVTFVMVESI